MATKTNNMSSTGTVAGVHKFDRITKSAHDGIDAAANAVHPTIDRAAASAHHAVEHADDMANYAAEAITKASAQSGKMLDASTNYVRKHPLFTLSLAVGMGYVLSRLLVAR
jgi:ElaB/YqjD/DUF883 family membrane-anchored ribosome-binding protein